MSTSTRPGTGSSGNGAPPLYDSLARARWRSIAERPIGWLVDQIVMVQQYGSLSGEKGTGKTVALLDMGVSVALGALWLGRFICQRGRVLVLTSEDSEFDSGRWIDAIVRSKDHEPAMLEDWRIRSPDAGLGDHGRRLGLIRRGAGTSREYRPRRDRPGLQVHGGRQVIAVVRHGLRAHAAAGCVRRSRGRSRGRPSLQPRQGPGAQIGCRARASWSGRDS